MNLYKIFFVGVLSPNVVVFGQIEVCCPKNDPLLNMSLVNFITPSLYSENNTACDATPFLSLLFNALTLISSTIWSLNEVESYVYLSLISAINLVLVTGLSQYKSEQLFPSEN
mgnify:CR=1 FL=1